jgi:hypothetical protein
VADAIVKALRDVMAVEADRWVAVADIIDVIDTAAKAVNDVEAAAPARRSEAEGATGLRREVEDSHEALQAAHAFEESISAELCLLAVHIPKFILSL